MLALARYALKGPGSAFTAVALLGILSLFVPLISLLSGALVGLIILTQGLVSGARVITLSIVLISAITWVMLHEPAFGITIGLMQWLPMVILATVLRSTSSLSITMLVGMGIAGLIVLLQFILWPNAEDAWYELIKEVLTQAENSSYDFALIEDSLQIILHWMSLALVSIMLSTFVSTLLLARWWQAKLIGSDGYKKEFYTIQLGKIAALLSGLLLIAAMLMKQDWLTALSLVALAMFLFQGLAIVHVRANRTKRPVLILVIFYVLMLIIPQVVLLAAIIGLIDNWLVFRREPKTVS